MSETVLYSYFRSSCAYRVRIALNIKKIPYEMKFVNIYTGEQKDPTYMAVNPSAMVPSLMIDGHMLRQSTAIIEYLEDTRPSAPKLLPNDPHKRAAVREIAEIVACDIQPIQNLRVSAMVADFCQKYQPTITDDERMKIRNDWSREVITDRFRGIEKLLASTSGDYCVGNGITLADVFLAPQVDSLCLHV
mmetsp:Transcript_1591/g.4335  ORF Transcript_1591/g.4335 Transcript_1591/m.4335 type:complete len:190 (-) Transcript_1591:551-1120(-)